MRRLAVLIAIMMVAFVGLPTVVSAQTDDTTDVREIPAKAAEKARNMSKKKDELRLEIQSRIEARKAQLKLDACERSEEKLNKLIPKLSNGATTVKAQIDKSYQRVQDFYASGKLTTPNYQELVDAIELAKADAENSMEALESFEFEVDCETATVAGQLDAYREAVKGVREDLKSYRKTVVDLISALKSANASQNKTTEDNSNSDTDDTSEETEEVENE